MEIALAVRLSSASGKIAEGFLPKTARGSKEKGFGATWSLNIRRMTLSSTLPFVSSVIIRDESIEDGRGINTNWGLVPFSEISLQGTKEELAKFSKRHRISVPRSQKQLTVQREIPGPSQQAVDTQHEIPINAAWPLPKSK
jgi:hypothetical protein